MTFGEKVRENRQLLRLTQEDLGRLVGVSRRSILAYETQGIRPRAAMLRKLAGALGVSERYMEDDGVDDPLAGKEQSPCAAKTRERFGAKAAQEIGYLMDRNAALFSGGEVSQEQKDAYFETVVQAYLACVRAGGASRGRKQEP